MPRDVAIVSFAETPAVRREWDRDEGEMLVPVLAGWSVLNRLKRNPRTRHIPVHVISIVERGEKAATMGAFAYVEKPVSHNILEGRRIIEAARKYGKICQTGTQSRSMKGMRDAIAFLHGGTLGTVRLARGICYKLRPSIGKVKGPQKPPATLDYDLWCGPAPRGTSGTAPSARVDR